MSGERLQTNGMMNGVNESSRADSSLTVKRDDYLEWNDYFMAIAFLSAQRSKDPRTQVGACIVNEDKKIVGIGYNGMPNGCSDDLMPWCRIHEADNVLESKQLYVCHAELNAVLNKNSSDVKNCTIYVALFPCNECAKVLIQSGIKEVIFYSDKYSEKPEFQAAKRMFDLSGVTYRQYRPKKKQIVINFESMEPSPSHSYLSDLTNLSISPKPTTSTSGSKVSSSQPGTKIVKATSSCLKAASSPSSCPDSTTKENQR